jgi:hypothetical protein
MSGVSKSQVSRLCAELDERVGAFLNRQIEGDWPHLWIDATYVKTREAGRIVSVAVTVAVGVNTDGRREVLGLKVGASEAEPFWTEFLRRLNRRGLRGVKLVISDSHEGIKAAAAKVLKATWQRCRVHFMRNTLAHAGETQRRMVSAAVGTGQGVRCCRPGPPPPAAIAERTAPRRPFAFRIVANARPSDNASIWSRSGTRLRSYGGDRRPTRRRELADRSDVMFAARAPSGRGDRACAVRVRSVSSQERERCLPFE